MSDRQQVAIREVVRPIGTHNPARASSSAGFVYIDLSAVDQDRKVIAGARQLACSDAPSRARQLVATRDVLVSTVRPNLNGVACVPQEMDGATASTGFCVLRPDTARIDAAYLFQWVKTPDFVADMVRKATGASYPAVSDRIVLASCIPLPPLAEQRRIGEVLGLADALRTKRRAALAQLDNLTQSIFLDMFGDTVANPKGWPAIQLGDVVFSASDGPHVSPDYVQSGIPFLSTRHVRPGGMSWEDLKFISPEVAQIHWRKCKPERGDLLYTKGGTTGIAKVVDWDKPVAIWVHIALLKTDKTKVEPLWLEAMLNNPFCYQQSQRLTRGIANRDLGLTRMVTIRMYLPPISLQHKFVRRVASVEALKATQRTSLGELDTLFASLQHRAFRGEL
ncbi:MAG: hypothetical protein ABIQ63_06600 [Rhodanobacter sp.]